MPHAAITMIPGRSEAENSTDENDMYIHADFQRKAPAAGCCFGLRRGLISFFALYGFMRFYAFACRRQISASPRG